MHLTRNMLLLFQVVAGSTLSAQETRWEDPVTGNWSRSSLWSNGVPTTSSRVVIDAVGTGSYQSRVQRDYTISSLLLNSDMATLELNAQLNVSGVAEILSGTLDINRDAVFNGGELRVNGGRLIIDDGTIQNSVLTLGHAAALDIDDATLDNVRVVGEVNLTTTAPVLRLNNGTTIDGAIRYSGLFGASVVYDRNGDTTIRHDIFDEGQGVFSLVFLDNRNLTLDHGFTIEARSTNIAGENNREDGGQFTNNGLIRADGFGKRVGIQRMFRFRNNSDLLARGGGSVQIVSVNNFQNHGTITAFGSDSNVLITAENWYNADNGVIQSSGGSIELDGTWRNDGSILAQGGTLKLGGNFEARSSGLLDGRILAQDAEVTLTGILDNTGEELSLGSLGGVLTVDDGTIRGGVITENTLDLLSFNSYGENTLDSVQIQSDLRLDGSVANLNLVNGTSVSGEILLLAESNQVGLGTGQVFTNTIRESGSNFSSIIIGRGEPAGVPSEQFTFGEDSLVEASTLTVRGFRDIVNRGTFIADGPGRGISIERDGLLINEGQMSAINGGDLSILFGHFQNAGRIDLDGTDSQFSIFTSTWENSGTIHAHGGLVELGGSFSTQSSGFGDGRITGSGDAVIEIRGFLDNSLAVLDTSLIGTTLRLNRGTIAGGSILGSAVRPLQFTDSFDNFLDDVTFLGDFVIDGTDSTVWLRGGSSATGDIRLAGTDTRLGFERTDIGDGVSIIDSGSGTQEIFGVIGGELVLAETSSIEGRRIDIGSLAGFSRTGDSFVNNGTIHANAVSNDSFGIHFRNLSNGFINNGKIEASNGGAVRISGLVDTFVSNGDLLVSDATSRLSIFADTWSNQGRIDVTDGRLTLGGDFTLADSGLLDGRLVGTEAATLMIAGLLDNTGTALQTDSFGGSIILSNGRVQNGILENISGREIRFSSSSTNLFDSVEVLGDLILGDDRSTLRLRGTSSVSGDILLTGTDTRLGLEGLLELQNTRIIADSDHHSVTVEGNSQITIGSNSSIRGRSLILGGFYRQGGFNRILENLGTITASGLSDTGLVFNDLYTPNNLPMLRFTNLGVLEAIDLGTVVIDESIDFTNLVNGVLAGGTYRVGAGSVLDLGRPLVANAADIELLGADAVLVGLEGLEVNSGKLTVGNGFRADLNGHLLFESSSQFTVIVSGMGDDIQFPSLIAADEVSLGGELVLDFTTYGIDGLSQSMALDFLQGSLFIGTFDEVTIRGIDEQLVSYVGGGTLTLIPAPSSLAICVPLGISCVRRRRARGAASTR